MKLFGIVAIALIASTALAQQASPPVHSTPGHPLDPTVGEYWKERAEDLKRDRDQLEVEVATLRAALQKARGAWEAGLKEIDRLKKALAKAMAEDYRGW